MGRPLGAAGRGLGPPASGAAGCGLEPLALERQGASCWPRRKAGEPGIVLWMSAGPRPPVQPLAQLSHRVARGEETVLQARQRRDPDLKVSHPLHRA